MTIRRISDEAQELLRYAIEWEEEYLFGDLDLPLTREDFESIGNTFDFSSEALNELHTLLESPIPEGD